MKAKLRIALAVVFVAAIAGISYFIVAQKPLAPAIEITTLQGDKIALSALRGKVVLVNFWATSCTTCVHEMPQIKSTYEQFSPRGYETLAIAMNYDTPEYIRAYVAKNGLPFTVAHDAQGAAAAAFGDIRLTPTTFLIDKQGHIVQRYLGEPDFTQLHALIDKLLSQSA